MPHASELEIFISVTSHLRPDVTMKAEREDYRIDLGQIFNAVVG
jgi:hypothetical protein